MAKGTIQCLKKVKKFRFITPEELFSHFSAIQGNSLGTIKDVRQVDFESPAGYSGADFSSIDPAG